jgi:hypothetical protein
MRKLCQFLLEPEPQVMRNRSFELILCAAGGAEKGEDLRTVGRITNWMRSARRAAAHARRNVQRMVSEGIQCVEYRMHNPAPQSTSPARSSHSRRPVSGTDLNLFNAIVGEQPILPPADAARAAAKKLEDATLAQVQKEKQKRNRKLPKIAVPQAAPAMLKQLRAAWHRGISLRVKRPNLAHWLRDFSDQVLHRLEEAQNRLTAARQKVRPLEQRAADQRPQTVRFNSEAQGMQDSYPLPQFSERPSPSLSSRSKVA